MTFRRIHLILGLLVFVAFTTTGSYMRDFPDKGAISQELRLLMRSRHIYILFSALIHLWEHQAQKLPIWPRYFCKNPIPAHINFLALS